MGHMPYTGQAGFDLYIGSNYQNMKFYRTSNFDFNKTEYEFTFFNHESLSFENKLFVLNFPLYATVDEVLFGELTRGGIVNIIIKNNKINFDIVHK